MLTGSTSDAFKQGFFAGSRDQDEAIAFSQKISDEKNADISLKNLEFSTAIAHGNRAAGHTSNLIMKQIDSRMGNVSHLINLYGVEGTEDQLEESLQAILDGYQVGDHKLQSNGPVA